MKIIYMHHAKRNMQDGRRQKNDITDNGIKEAEIIAEMIKSLKGTVKAIYSSP